MLFQVIPPKFFSPLASPGKLMYWDCIYQLFTLMRGQLSFGIERDLLVDELQLYFEEDNAAEIQDDSDFNTKNSRDKANAVLRSLESYGWITIETDKSYIQRVNFTDYAVKILKVLIDISEGKQTEYQGYIYTIYSLVKSSDGKPGIVLNEIAKNTEAMITALKNLNSSIKKYIDNLTKHHTVAELMNVLFNDYFMNVIDKAYHRLLTSDNVAKFRPEIIDRLECKRHNPQYIEEATADLMSIEELEAEKAKERVFDLIHNVIEAFRRIDEIMEDINQKNMLYQKAAINRARFLLSGNEDIRGQIKDILLYMNEQINLDQLDYSTIYQINFTDNLIRLYHSSFIDERSFYKPTEGTKAFHPIPIMDEVIDEKARAEKLRKMQKKLERILSVSKINQYILEMLKGREVMRASELPLASDEDFIKLIYVRLYGSRKNMRYQIHVKEKVKIGPYHFTDFEIWNKKPFKSNNAIRAKGI
ncbi:Wadjet anti-phage system protein JetA family protein [Eubacterium limosum]|uniref:Wadjet anti-phage system protein JetA family protein n=1 Tax=Eubacterium limosum TaxID=1736 RepID=UPI0022E7C005|nr:Wadjet anti-phage system protein JetA family protein [Eubacterium limosum]